MSSSEPSGQVYRHTTTYYSRIRKTYKNEPLYENTAIHHRQQYLTAFAIFGVALIPYPDIITATFQTQSAHSALGALARQEPRFDKMGLRPL